MTTASQPQPSSSVVGRLYEDFQRILKQIDDSDVSLRNSAEDIFQKSLAVAIGNYFERRVTDIVLELFEKSSGDNVLVSEFVRKNMSRQYHNYFAWRKANANRFYGLFGEDFKGYMEEYVKHNPKYGDCVKAFMQIGNLRNKVAHTENPAINQTTQELYALYEKAFFFVEELPSRFEEFEQNRASEQA